MIMWCRLTCVCRVLSKRSSFPGNGRTLFTPVAWRRLYTSQVIDEEVNGAYPLPWNHNRKPLRPNDPYLHRQVGLFLLRRVANLHGSNFSVSEFLHGVRDAVYSLAKAITDQETHSQLELFLGRRLCSAVRRSLGALPENAHIHLDIESIRNMHLSSINATVGMADQGDEHVISWLGQSVITSQTGLQNLMDEDSRFTFSKAREIGKEATFSRLEFRLGVSFGTKEKFAVLDEEGRVVMGSNQFRDCFHFWTFSSLVAWETDEYPFQWIIVDVNDFVEHSSNT